ncbi:hypothetical protein D3C71_1415040 [compost metagenome]
MYYENSNYRYNLQLVFGPYQRQDGRADGDAQAHKNYAQGGLSGGQQTDWLPLYLVRTESREQQKHNRRY